MNNNTGAELSKYNLKLKDQKIQYDISWKILHKIEKNNILNKICKTCNLEILK